MRSNKSNKQNVPVSASVKLRKQFANSVQHLTIKNNKMRAQKKKSGVFTEHNLPALDHRYAEEDFQVQKKKDCILGMSTIEMLKKQAKLLEDDEYLGTIQRFSTLESKSPPISQNMLLQVTKFHKANNRKVAKGRPELYNWVRNHNKEIAETETDWSHYSQKKSINQICQRGTFVERLRKLEQIKQKSKSYQLKPSKNFCNEEDYRVKTEI